MFSGNGVTAKNTNAVAGQPTYFKLNQNVNYFGVVEKTIDTFWFSVASPINYGIVQKGAVKIEGTVNNNGDATVKLTPFQWIDFSNNKGQISLDDTRIKSVTCEPIIDDTNIAAAVSNMKVNRVNSELTFDVAKDVVTDKAILNVKFIITDMWGIQTELPGEITIKRYNQ